jgi:hypothetical protein
MVFQIEAWLSTFRLFIAHSYIHYQQESCSRIESPESEESGPGFLLSYGGDNGRVSRSKPTPSPSEPLRCLIQRLITNQLLHFAVPKKKDHWRGDHRRPQKKDGPWRDPKTGLAPSAGIVKAAVDRVSDPSPQVPQSDSGAVATLIDHISAQTMSDPGPLNRA